jgi:TolB-like protein
MKRCPECRRDYYDDTLSFCLEDGEQLVYGVSNDRIMADEPATAIFSQMSGGTVGLAQPASQPSEPVAPMRHSVQEPKDEDHSIAVLPFVNMSADEENEYFCDGLAEELLNALSKIDQLKVAARTSAFSFRRKNVNINEIGKTLSVKTVLEGSVRKSGERVRISVQLVNAADGYQIWSERYDREMQDIFDVQDEITLSVISALKLKLLGGEKSPVLKRETENTEAYKAYLKGRYLRYAKNDHRGAAAAYEEAVNLDPSHAPSWLGLAESYVLRAHYGMVQPREACSKARDALATARRIHGETAEALYIEGFTAFIERDWRACDDAYHRSLLMEPNNSRALGTYGIINCILGRIDEAAALFDRSREADPLAAYPYAMTGGGLAILRRPDEAQPFFEQAFTFDKDQTLALWTYCETCIALKRFDDGIAAAERAVTTSQRAGFLLAVLGCALASAGRTAEATAVLVELRSRPPGSNTLVHEACLLGILGDKDAAFDMLSRAADELAPMACYVGLPSFDSLRDDPRFKDMLKRMNLPE